MMRYFKRVAAYFLLVLLASCASSGLKQVTPPPPASTVGYFPPKTPEIPLKQDGSYDKDFVYPVMFGTNRKPTADKKGFTEDRDQKLSYGRVLVEIPKNHKVGSTGGGAQNFFLGDDPPLRIKDVQVFEKDSQFLAYARDTLKPVTSPENGYLLVYIHGYNTSFKMAALRAAQLGVDLDVPEENMYFFSWPAIDSLETYTRDEASMSSTARRRWPTRASRAR